MIFLALLHRKFANLLCFEMIKSARKVVLFQEIMPLSSACSRLVKAQYGQ